MCSRSTLCNHPSHKVSAQADFKMVKCAAKGLRKLDIKICCFYMPIAFVSVMNPPIFGYLAIA